MRIVPALLATLLVVSTEPTSDVPALGASAPAVRQPDRVADHIGGIAARVRRTDGTAVPGDLYLLMATVGSDRLARLYEETPYTHERGRHDDTDEANARAVSTAEAITGATVEPLPLTHAPGGGPSAGLTYLIAYLNVISGGALTAGVRVAATGALADEGYIDHITGATEKLGAARLADVDVLFTPTAPTHAAVAEHAERHVGRRHRSRHGRVTLAIERDLDEYATWGATAPDGLDVVGVGHIADVAAYLCGAGSSAACAIRDQLAGTVTTDEETQYDRVRLAATPTSTPDDAADRASTGSPR